MNRIFFATIFLISGITLNARVSRLDYQRADSASHYNDLVYHSISRYGNGWIDTTCFFWYKIGTRQGDEYYIVDVEAGTKDPAFNVPDLCKLLNEATGKKLRPDSLPIFYVSFRDSLKVLEFDLDSTKWSYRIKDNKLEDRGTDPRMRRSGRRRSGSSDREKTVLSPDSSYQAFIREYNVWLRDPVSKEETQLSFDGSAGEYYTSLFQWSPDSRKLATIKVRDYTKHMIHFVESSPPDQLQPKLHELEYLKPGDALPIRKPELFDIATKKQVPLNTLPFDNQFSLYDENLSMKWWKDSRAFTFEFNQRGHQVYQVVEVDAETGQTRILIDESSKTFIDYSGKKFRHDLDDGRQIIWASERDGWNHLYLFDGKTGQVINQITRGEWVVRRVIDVDDKNRQILFAGSGRNREEDPYLVHYYRVDFSGKNLVDLTPEKAYHQASLSKDKKYLFDTWSRADLPPVSVMRSASTGEIIMELEKADISELLATGWKFPEAFVAKGRDGKTDIWGNIYRPSNFDPSKKYPVLEYIYAGPHSSFVRKTFEAYNGSITPMTELGFILVQIDGMGTSNRSKAFHDVCWKNLRDAGFPDRILWMKAAAGKYPYMDLSRVGIYGTSAGGQNALGGMLFHGDFYRTCVASCGCHDNRMDKIWWNEQWMGYPIGPQYDSSSNVVNAYRLQGDLLLFVGEVDSNVDPASTMQVADALIKAGKEFELVVLPGMNHTNGGKFGERKRRDFFVKHLMGEETPDWNRPQAE